MRDAKYSLKMAAEKWRQKFPFLNAFYSYFAINDSVFSLYIYILQPLIANFLFESVK